MRVIKIPTANGIDDVKMIGETTQERLFIKQLAEAGTLTSLSRQVADSIVFRAISVVSDSETGSFSQANSIGLYDFRVRQNQTFLLGLKFRNQSGPIDLTQYTGIRIQVKLNKGGDTIFEVSIGAGLDISGDDNEILNVSFSSGQTMLLDRDTYYYDVLFQKPTSNVYYLEGKITVNKSITR